MFLKHVPSGDLVEVLDLPAVIDPSSPNVRVREYINDQLQRPDNIPKSELVFPSGEALPRCWIDSHYREFVAA